MDRRELNRIIDHVAAAIDAAPAGKDPFFHLRLANIFPPDVYAKMMREMPVASDYRRMSGRTKSTRTMDGGGTRVKIDLFPEYIRHLPREKRELWNTIGKVLCSAKVRDVFMRRLAPGLERRYGANYNKVGMYPIPILTRDVPGYRIGIHPDTHWKGMTIQLYLPRDNSIDHIGTVFHSRNPDKTFARASQMKFAPNSALRVRGRQGYLAFRRHGGAGSRDARFDPAHLLRRQESAAGAAQPRQVDRQFYPQRSSQHRAALTGSAATAG